MKRHDPLLAVSCTAMTTPSPEARACLWQRHPRFRTQAEPRRGRPPYWGPRLRGNKLRRLALGLSLTALALSCMDGTPPAAAQPAATQGMQVLTAAQLQARRDRIRGFFQARLQRLRTVATTVTPSGQTIDWIHPQSQAADSTLAQPPEPPVPPRTDTLIESIGFR